MDFNSLKDQVSNLSLYDIKAGVRKVQNAVMNYTEMEAKVREATNNEPWGASSTLMQEISNGTHSYHLLNEIMPMIYKRFTEKAAEEWRQIYKALQLLEFLIKNGSERVIDDARSHVSLLKMLRQFHYIDQNGKDQGVNVRNRAKELADLLSDSERIRSERKKSRANRNKFGGVEGGAMSGGLSSGSRYGGFGSEEAGFGGYSGGVYGDGGGFGGRESDFQDSSRRDRFEEYDENDEDGAPAARRRTDGTKRESKRASAAKPKEPEVDFLSFDDDVPPETPPKEFSPVGKRAASSSLINNGSAALHAPLATTNDDDDFDDFQSATPTTTASASTKPSSVSASFGNIAIPTPVAPAQTVNMGALNAIPSPAPSSTSGIAAPPAPNYNVNMSAPSAPAKPIVPPQAAPSQQQPRPSGYQAAQPNYFTSVQVGGSAAPSTSSTPGATSAFASPPSSSTSTLASNAAKKPAASGGSGGDAFGNLWSSASTSAGIKNAGPGGAAGAKGPNLASLQREKASQGIWGAPAASTTPAAPTPQAGFSASGAAGGSMGGSGLDDLLG